MLGRAAGHKGRNDASALGWLGLAKVLVITVLVHLRHLPRPAWAGVVVAPPPLPLLRRALHKLSGFPLAHCSGYRFGVGF